MKLEAIFAHQCHVVEFHDSIRATIVTLLPIKKHYHDSHSVLARNRAVRPVLPTRAIKWPSARSRLSEVLISLYSSIDMRLSQKHCMTDSITSVGFTSFSNRI